MLAALPSAAQLRAQADWLAPARARLLRHVSIAHRQSVLDLGAGYGAVTGELVRRANGRVVALDRSLAALNTTESFLDAKRVNADACALPFAARTFDLIFCQWALLWMTPLAHVLAECERLLQPGGALVALEPDYGGLIEHPPAIVTRELWLAALTRAGAEPLIGRILPGQLARLGFSVRVDLLTTLYPPSAERFALLRGLPLTEAESQQLTNIEHSAAGLSDEWTSVAHLPIMLITATKPM